MGRRTGPVLGGVFLPDDAIASDPASEEAFVAHLESALQEPCEECGDPVIECECGAQWLGEPEHH